jgi:ketosteroid isomerase-like protein
MTGPAGEKKMPANELEALTARVDRLESRQAIGELVTAYAVACDEHDMPKLTSLFTEDACFDSPSGAMVANGRAAIAALFIDLFKIRGPAFHWTHDLVATIEPTDPNRATGRVLSHAETTPGNVVSLAAMRYDDQYQRDNGVWRFKKRVINFLYYVPVTEYATALNQPERLTIRGVRTKADYPESLPAWQQFIRQHITPTK